MKPLDTGIWKDHLTPVPRTPRRGRPTKQQRTRAERIAKLYEIRAECGLPREVGEKMKRRDWIVELGEERGTWIIYDEKQKYEVAVVYAPLTEARLIAKAPQLLEMLRARLPQAEYQDIVNELALEYGRPLPQRRGQAQVSAATSSSEGGSTSSGSGA